MKNPQLGPPPVPPRRRPRPTGARTRSWSGPRCRTSTRGCGASSPATSATTRRKSWSSSRRPRWVYFSRNWKKEVEAVHIKNHPFSCAVLHPQLCMNFTQIHTHKQLHTKLSSNDCTIVFRRKSNIQDKTSNAILNLLLNWKKNDQNFSKVSLY